MYQDPKHKMITFKLLLIVYNSVKTGILTYEHDVLKFTYKDHNFRNKNQTYNYGNIKEHQFNEKSSKELKKSMKVNSPSLPT